MKRIALVMILALAVTPALFAQDDAYNHGSVGAFFNMTRLHHAGDRNWYGFGGRVGFNVHPNVALEAEMAYDFARNFTVSTGGGGTATSSNFNLRLLHGFFGPKFSVGPGAFKVYGTVKGGILNFSTNHSVSGQIAGVPNGDTNGVLYPAGGVEMNAGWFGIRAELGDEIYFDRGANNNLRFTVGPQIRF